MSAITATIRKDLLILIKDPAALVMLFILPAIFIMVLSLAMQGAFADKNSKEKFSILVVNQDEGDFGDALIENINANGYFKVVEKENVEKAKQMVESGRHPLLVVIPKTASRALTHGGEQDIVLFQDPAFSKEMAYSVMNGIREFVYVSLLDKMKDATKKQTSAISTLEEQVDTLSTQLKSTAALAKDLQQRFQAMGMGRRPRAVLTAEDTDSDEADAGAFPFQKPEKAEVIPASAGLQVSQQFLSSQGRTDAKPSSVQQNVPGWTIFALFWIAQVLAINIISERQSGAFRRVMVSPVSFHTYILSKSIPFLFINLFQAIFLFLIGVYVLPHFGCTKLVIINVPALALLTFAVSIVAVSFGLMLAGFLATPFAAASVSASILVVMTALAGIMVPKFVMPATMQELAKYIPQGIALEGYLDVLLRNRSIAQILPAVGMLLLFALGFSLFGLFCMRRIR